MPVTSHDYRGTMNRPNARQQYNTFRATNRGRVTHLALARREGLTRSAISKRLSRRRARLAKQQPAPERKPTLIRPIQMSVIEGLV